MEQTATVQEIVLRNFTAELVAMKKASDNLFEKILASFQENLCAKHACIQFEKSGDSEFFKCIEFGRNKREGLYPLKLNYKNGRITILRIKKARDPEIIASWNTFDDFERNLEKTVDEELHLTEKPVV